MYRTVLYTLVVLCFMKLQVSTLPVTESSVVPEIETIKLDEIVDTAITKLELQEQQIQQIQHDIIHIADVLENQSFEIKKLQDVLVPLSNQPTENGSEMGQENVAYNIIQAPNKQVYNEGQNQETSELQSMERSQELESQELIESMGNLGEVMSPELESPESAESVDNTEHGTRELQQSGVEESIESIDNTQREKVDSHLFEPQESVESKDNLEKGEYSYY